MANLDLAFTVRRVVCAANRNSTGWVILGVRHWDNHMRAQVPGWMRHDGFEQGFVDQYGVFMDRKEAWIVAEAAGQIIRRVGGDGVELYSENLY